jgi:hypothetical protein
MVYSGAYKIKCLILGITIYILIGRKDSRSKPVSNNAARQPSGGFGSSTLAILGITSIEARTF